MNLKAFQEEIRNLVFIRPEEAATSRLWKDKIPERMDVYKNNTRSNWTDTLDHDFPLTRLQFSSDAWEILRRNYFIKHPPQHWELNTSVSSFVRFLKTQKCDPWIAELADYEWHDLKVFIDRSTVQRGSGLSNPTVVIRPYQHQIFFWVDSGAAPDKPPQQKPEVLVFYRDSKNTCHIQEADPLMILVLEHFKKPKARLETLEPFRRRLLPNNRISLQTVYDTLQKSELIL